MTLQPDNDQAAAREAYALAADLRSAAATGAPADLTTATLDDLATAARAAVALTGRHLSASLDHFVRFGEILLAARDRMDKAAWNPWLDANGIARTQASHATRLAFYAPVLPSAAVEPFVDGNGSLRNPSYSRALLYLRGLPDIRDRSAAGGWSADVVAEAKRLRETGMTYKTIAEVIGVPWSTVSNWLDPNHRASVLRQTKKRAAERRATGRIVAAHREREERDRLARATGGNLENVYFLIRRALLVVSKTNAESVERYLAKAEDELNAFMKATDT